MSAIKFSLISSLSLLLTSISYSCEAKKNFIYLFRMEEMFRASQQEESPEKNLENLELDKEIDNFLSGFNERENHYKKLYSYLNSSEIALILLKKLDCVQYEKLWGNIKINLRDYVSELKKQTPTDKEGWEYPEVLKGLKKAGDYFFSLEKRDKAKEIYELSPSIFSKICLERFDRKSSNQKNSNQIDHQEVNEKLIQFEKKKNEEKNNSKISTATTEASSIFNSGNIEKFSLEQDDNNKEVEEVIKLTQDLELNFQKHTSYSVQIETAIKFPEKKNQEKLKKSKNQKLKQSEVKKKKIESQPEASMNTTEVNNSGDTTEQSQISTATSSAGNSLIKQPENNIKLEEVSEKLEQFNQSEERKEVDSANNSNATTRVGTQQEKPTILTNIKDFFNNLKKIKTQPNLSFIQAHIPDLVSYFFNFNGRNNSPVWFASQKHFDVTLKMLEGLAEIDPKLVCKFLKEKYNNKYDIIDYCMASPKNLFPQLLDVINQDVESISLLCKKIELKYSEKAKHNKKANENEKVQKEKFVFHEITFHNIYDNKDVFDKFHPSIQHKLCRLLRILHEEDVRDFLLNKYLPVRVKEFIALKKDDLQKDIAYFIDPSDGTSSCQLSALVFSRLLNYLNNQDYDGWMYLKEDYKILLSAALLLSDKDGPSNEEKKKWFEKAPNFLGIDKFGCAYRNTVDSKSLTSDLLENLSLNTCMKDRFFSFVRNFFSKNIIKYLQSNNKDEPLNEYFLQENCATVRVCNELVKTIDYQGGFFLFFSILKNNPEKPSFVLEYDYFALNKNEINHYNKQYTLYGYDSQSKKFVDQGKQPEGILPVVHASSKFDEADFDFKKKRDRLEAIKNRDIEEIMNVFMSLHPSGISEDKLIFGKNNNQQIRTDYKTLAKEEPYCLQMKKIEELTDFRIYHIYLKSF